MRDMMINAMKTYYIGLVNKHLVNIENMLTRSVGIGEPEHQDVFSALDVEMEKLANCNDKLIMVGKYLERSLENEKSKTKEKPKSK
tara:strand:- start:52 stop:309 length:258 start_codon:yes stop_codon:yes gene_type:complete